MPVNLTSPLLPTLRVGGCAPVCRVAAQQCMTQGRSALTCPDFTAAQTMTTRNASRHVHPSMHEHQSKDKTIHMKGQNKTSAKPCTSAHAYTTNDDDIPASPHSCTVMRVILLVLPETLVIVDIFCCLLVLVQRHTASKNARQARIKEGETGTRDTGGTVHAITHASNCVVCQKTWLETCVRKRG